MKNHKRLLVSQCKYTKTPMSKFECFGHAVKGQCYTLRIQIIHNASLILNGINCVIFPLKTSILKFDGFRPD